MQRRQSIRTKILLVALAINAVVIIAFSVTAYLLQERTFLQGVDGKLLVAAHSVPHLLPPSYHADIRGPNSISPEEYDRAQQALTRYARANGLAYIYTYVEDNGQFYIASTSASEHELATHTVPDFYHRYMKPPPAMIAAWRTDTPETAEYEDEYGDFRSIFVPMHSIKPDGASGTRYIIGSDVNVSFIDQQLRNTVLLFVGVGLAIFAIVGMVGEPLLGRMLSAIGRLTNSTHDLMEGDFQLSDEHREALAKMARGRRDEIGQLAHAFQEMVKRLGTYIEDLKVVTAAKERIESEMKIAGGIQQSFLPQAYTAQAGQATLDMHAVLHPAKQVGGDLYDYFDLDDEHLFFAIGDVSDKGMPAALFMAVTLTLLRTLIKHETTPDRLLDSTNRLLIERNEASQFVTLFCGVLNTRTGEVSYAHGGHNPPYVYSPERNELRALTPVSGIALGAFDVARYHTEHLTLAPGDVLFLYTDGITEAMNSDRRLYGEQRLETCLQAVTGDDSAEAVTDKVLADVARHAGDAPQSDDVTMLCIRFERRGSADAI